jgi:hypothetical protein
MREDDHKEFLLSALRAASLRAEVMKTEINTVGIALKSDMVTVGQAVKWLKDISALEFVGMIPDEIVTGAAE